MTDLPARKRWSVAWIVAGVVFALLGAVIGLGVLLLSRYQHTENVDAASAAREFQATRARFTGQTPLLELRGIELPVFHRERASARPVTSLHALVYSRRDESLTRWNLPIEALRVITVGGYVRLLDFGMPGNNNARLTLEDLEQHGPGLVVDVPGGAVAPIAVRDALIGSTTSDSQLLMWTE